MGRNNHRDEAVARKRKSGVCVPSSDSTVREALLSPYIQDTVQKGESGDYTRLETMVVHYLEQKSRGKHCFLVKDNLNSPRRALLQQRASLRAKEKETLDIAYNGRPKVSALEVKSVE